MGREERVMRFEREKIHIHFPIFFFLAFFIGLFFFGWFILYFSFEWQLSLRTMI